MRKAYCVRERPRGRCLLLVRGLAYALRVYALCRPGHHPHLPELMPQLCPGIPAVQGAVELAGDAGSVDATRVRLVEGEAPDGAVGHLAQIQALPGFAEVPGAVEAALVSRGAVPG